MVKRLFLVIIVVASIITAMWALGVFKPVGIDPPLDDLDGIAIVKGAVWDLASATGLTFARVTCGGVTAYTLDSNLFTMEIPLDSGLTQCSVGAFVNGYYSAHVTVELNDLIPARADLFLEEIFSSGSGGY